MSKMLVVVGMGADPKPDYLTFVFHGEGSVVQAHPDGPKASHLLKLQ